MVKVEPEALEGWAATVTEQVTPGLDAAKDRIDKAYLRLPEGNGLQSNYAARQLCTQWAQAVGDVGTATTVYRDVLTRGANLYRDRDNWVQSIFDPADRADRIAGQTDPTEDEESPPTPVRIHVGGNTYLE